MTVNGPLNQLTQAIQKNQMTLRQGLSFWAKRREIIAENTRNLTMHGQAQLLASGKAKVLLTSMKSLNAATVTAGQSMRLFNTLLSTVGKSLIMTGKRVQWAGRQIMVGLGLPLLLIAGIANKAFEELNLEMTRTVKVSKLTAEAGTEAFEAQEAAVERQSMALYEQGAAMGFVVEETAKMVTEFAEMGFAGSALDKMTESALLLSRVSGTDLAESVQLTRILHQAYGIEINKVSGAMARLNMIENSTSLTLSEMAQALPVVANVAATLGLEAQETAAMLAIMNENGVSAKEGAQALRTSLVFLVQEMKGPARDAFTSIGVDIDGLKNKMQESGGDVFTFFEGLSDELKKLEGNQAAINEFAGALGKLFGTRQVSRMIPVIEQIGKMNDILAIARESFGKAEEAGLSYSEALGEVNRALVAEGFDPNDIAVRSTIGMWIDAEMAMEQYIYEFQKMQNSAAGISQRLRAEMQLELAKIGETTLELTNTFRQMVVNILKWFNNLSDGTRKMVSRFLAFGTVLGFAIMIAGVFANALGSIITILTYFLPKFKIMTAAMQAEIAAHSELAAAAQAAQNRVEELNEERQEAVASAQAHAAAARGEAASLSGVATSAQAAAAANQSSATSSQAAALATAKTSKNSSLLVRILKGLGKFSVYIMAIGFAITFVYMMIQDMSSATKAFMDKFKPAWDSLRVTFILVKTEIKLLFDEIFRGMGGAEKGAATFGKAFGMVVAAIVDFVGWLVRVISDYIVPAVRGWAGMFQMLAGVLTGDMDLIRLGIENVQKAFRELFLNIERQFWQALETIGIFSEKATARLEEIGRSWLNLEQQERDFITALNQGNEVLKTTDRVIETINSKINSAKQTELDLIRLGLMDKELSAMIEEQGLETTMQSLALRQDISDTQYNDLATLAAYQPILQVINRLRAEEARILMMINLLTQLIASGAMRSEDGIKRIRSMYSNFKEQLESSTSAFDEQIAKARQQEESFRNMRDEANGVSGAIGDIEDGMDEVEEAARDAAEAFREWMSALKSASGELINDIVQAVQRAVDEQRDGIEDYYDSLEDSTEEYYDNYLETMDGLLDESLDRIKSEYEADKERIESAADLEIKRIEDIADEEKALEAAREEFFNRERARIEYLSGKDKASLDIAAALASGDLSGAASLRIQQEAATRQYIADTMQMEEEAISARRDRERASLIQTIEDQKKAALDLLEINNKANIDAISQARERYRREVEIARQASFEKIRIAKESALAAAEAERLRIEEYLREWQRITPQTEEEFRQHLANLMSFMDASGARLTEQITGININLMAGLVNISNGMHTTIQGILYSMTEGMTGLSQNALDLLGQLSVFNSQSLNEMLNMLNSFDMEYERIMVSGMRVSEEFAELFGRSILDGFQWALDLAQRIIEENNKWKTSNDEIGNSYRNILPAMQGVNAELADMGSLIESAFLDAEDFLGSMEEIIDTLEVVTEKGRGFWNTWREGLQRFTELWERLGTGFQLLIGIIVALISPMAGLLIIVQSIRNLIDTFRRDGLLAAFMEILPKFYHEGGLVSGAGMSSGSDVPAILQEGEYVINRNAVDRLGVDFLDTVNGVNGAVFPAVSAITTTPAGITTATQTASSASNVYNLSFNISGDNIDSQALAQRVMFEIKKTERNKGVR